jgi:hypothetical protein
MFVMTNDGGPVSDNQARVDPILCQRAFIFDIMARSIPIALLHGATFRDSKVGDPLPAFELLTQVLCRLSHLFSSKGYSLILGAF